MTDMLSLFDAPEPVRRVSVAETPSERPCPVDGCNARFRTFPGFLGHLTTAHPVNR